MLVSKSEVKMLGISGRLKTLNDLAKRRVCCTRSDKVMTKLGYDRGIGYDLLPHVHKGAG